MSTHTFSCNLCEALCGLEVTVENGRVASIRPDKEDVLSRGHLCPKGPALRELHEDPDRLRTPMRRTPTGFVPVSWDEAMDEIGERLRAIRRAHGRDAIAYYVGNPTVHNHRAMFGAQLLSSALSTKNRFDPNSQDSAPRLFACMQMYGDGLAMAVPDLDRTEHLLMLGANPAASNGSMMSAGDPRGRLRAIRERGGRIVLVDPRRSESAAWADEHHFIRPGGDAALCMALLHVLFAEGRVDQQRVGERTNGLGELRSLSANFPPERVAAAVGIGADAIRKMARELADAKRACVYGRVGTSVNEFGPVAAWLIEALNVVAGNLDREGGAMWPRPAADVGPLARLAVGNHYGRWRSRVRGLPEFLGSLPSAAMAEEMETPGPGQIRAFICFAGNPVASTPNSARLARALGGLDLVVAVDQYVNETARLAHFVLPPLHVFETGNYDLVLLGLAVRNVAKWSPPILPRPDGGRDDFEILSELALRVRGPQNALLRRAALRAMKNLPERTIDLLLRTGPNRLSLAKLAKAPHGIDLGPLAPSGGRNVRTPDGRIRLAPAPLVADVPRLEKWVSERRAGDLVLIGRRHLRSNNSWLHNLKSLVKGPDRTALLMHPDDAARRALTDGATVRVASRVGAVRAKLAVSDEVMPGVVSLPHGFGQSVCRDTLRVAGALDAPNANALTDEEFVEPVIGTSILNGVPVTVAAE